jgi:PAS domain S-box-containing protein
MRTKTLWIKDEYLQQILDGKKTIEVRVGYGNMLRLAPGDHLMLNDRHLFCIKRIGRYASFTALLAQENHQSIAPELTSAELEAALHAIYPPEKESLGVIALELQFIDNGIRDRRDAPVLTDVGGEVERVGTTQVGTTQVGTTQDMQQALSESERRFRRELAHNQQILSAISSILIGVSADNFITHWNKAAEEIFGLGPESVIGRPLAACGIQWDWKVFQEHLAACLGKGAQRRVDSLRYRRPDGSDALLGLMLTPIRDEEHQTAGYLISGRDITNIQNMERQLIQAQKLKSIGQLAAGIAHEINTPTQYVGDNTRFLKDSFADLMNLLAEYQALLDAARTGEVPAELVRRVDRALQAADIEFLVEQIPLAIQQSLEGIQRISKIVSAMKEYSHPGSEGKITTDLNRAIESTVTVARNEWKYVAELELDLDPNLPLIQCQPGEINQVILNLITNAAHAIADCTGETGGEKGLIRISTCTCTDGAWVEIRVQDSGTGIPEDAKDYIFDPFFTTKEVGRGTGQGLSIAHNVIVEKHSGTIVFETEANRGTTFIIRLPVIANDANLHSPFL